MNPTSRHIQQPCGTAALRVHHLAMAVALGMGFVSAAKVQAEPVGNCEPLRQQIEAKFKANGVARVQLQVVDAAASSAGRVVGTCERGSRKIVRLADGPGASPEPAQAANGKSAPILTECKDGTTSMGGSCRK
jgi:hypothetical protein